ncbi:NAD(P)-binding protein [Clavulina sp. PMI_390]|nr:NAD(P)-binding protein [Clavulina sp. PMI_390]
MQSAKKVIAVLTATGTQGAGVVEELLKDGSFAVRGITRDPESAKAKALTARGVEMVKGDADDANSLTAAFEGAYGVFANTVWTIFPKEGYDQKKTEERETQQGKNMVDAAKKAGVQHFVWSTLAGISEPWVYHLMSKHKVNSYLAESGIPVWTLYYTSCYISNFAKPVIQFLKKDSDGLFFIDIPVPPDTVIPFFHGGESGKWVLPMFKDPSKYNGQRVDAVAEFLTPRQIAETIKRVTGVPVYVKELTVERFFEPSYRASVFDEMWLNCATWVLKLNNKNAEQSKSIVPSPTTLEEFLKTDPKTRELLGV